VRFEVSALGTLLLVTIVGCAPLPVTYYMPSSEYAAIRPYSCAAAPPYTATIAYRWFWTTGYFDGRRIEITLTPQHPSTISFETALLQVEVEGQLSSVSNLHYREPNSTGAAVQNNGLFSESGRIFYLTADSPVLNPANMILHIPPMTVDGLLIPAQTISFRRERKVLIRYLVLNC
jgi:hypothetical protein